MMRQASAGGDQGEFARVRKRSGHKYPKQKKHTRHKTQTKQTHPTTQETKTCPPLADPASALDSFSGLEQNPVLWLLLLHNRYDIKRWLSIDGHRCVPRGLRTTRVTSHRGTR